MLTLEKLNSANEYIQILTNAIVEKLEPEKIILFGSFAYGTPTIKSDIDILVIVKNSPMNRSERTGKLYVELKEFSKFPKDLLVYTIEEAKKWESVRQAFITSIQKNGQVLYER